MSPNVRCFWEHFDVMQRVVFPAMQRELEETQARGDETERANDNVRPLAPPAVEGWGEGRRK
jgi:hypothetical protein